MKRATSFMVEKASSHGGYVWSYLPDMSRRWGEIEATPSMIWVQPPGTATMGHLFLDAYHATGDEYYYQAAEKVAGALIRGQHRSGGWHYFIDFAGPAATRRWYQTIGKNAWRMEEFQHYADNATFDDMGTSEAAQFLLRIYLEKQDPRYRPALERAVSFVLDSQYPNGGWPQRWPYDPEYPDYQSYITFNDDVAAENVKFLLMAYQHLGETRALDAINRGMNVYLAAQQGAPQAGWALQHTLDLEPAAARTYEPKALATHTTASNVEQLMDFYRMTGDSRFLARIPEALDWLESVRLPDGVGPANRRFPTFVEIGSNRPIYVHRRGSNVVNGEYYWDYSPEATLGHYSAFRNIDVPRLRRDYAALKAMPVAEATKNSPLLAAAQGAPLPRYFVSGGMVGSDLNAGADAGSPRELIRSLNAQGWWPTPLKATSHTYKGDGPATPVPGDYRSTQVGDETDTSPYNTDTPVTGISTATYMANMAALIRSLDQRP
ncbi:pectate lyase [Sphingomonas parva]|uniref:Pectate lyase n=2 Tax=Sphingomonas parva TaxID=2555898 RepID=A0A4Y8ZLL5_9SPHN|nr:pectate lyase [Sphingomonas parva]